MVQRPPSGRRASRHGVCGEGALPERERGENAEEVEETILGNMSDGDEKEGRGVRRRTAGARGAPAAAGRASGAERGDGKGLEGCAGEEAC